MSKKQYKAIKYIRLSHADDKDGESNSVTNQRILLDSFIEKNDDIEVVSEMVDDGWSGIVFDRPAFMEMMVEIEAGNINCVIVKDLSRLGRERIEIGRYLRRIFPAYGVRFIAVIDNIDTLRESSDNLVVGIKSIMNDAYCRDISVKTRSALATKRSNGDYIGACTVYGYKKAADNKNKLVIDEYPAGVVHDIFRMKLEGMSAVKVAEKLNNIGVLSPLEYKKDRGLPHPTGGFADKADAKWSATTIIRILKDATYTGMLLQGKQSTFNYKLQVPISKPESEWVCTDDAHEAIINKRDFDLVQRIMRLDTRTSPDGEKVHLFSGILICGCCGGRMTRKTDHYKDRTYYYYYCPVGKKNGCVAPNRIKESELTSCLLESIKSHISNVVSLDTILNSAGNTAANSRLAKQVELQIAENEHQIKQIASFKSTLYENMINGTITKSEHRAYRAKYIADIAHLQQALSKLRQELDDVLCNRSERLLWMEHFRQLEGITELNRKTVAHLVQSICVISKTEIQVAFNYQLEYEKAAALLKKEAA